MCTYCGCESIDVIGRFMAEHIEIVNASGVLRRACSSGDAGSVAEAVEDLQRLLHPHTAAEEAGLLRVLGEDDEFTEHVRDLCAEHADLDAALARIREGELTSSCEFARALRSHIDREENGVFPAAAVAFAGPEWGRVDALTPAARQ
jgi:hemerythrin-like domain-containing protein